MPEMTDAPLDSLVARVPGFRLPPGWRVLGVSVTVPYYGRVIGVHTDYDQLEVRFAYHGPLKSTDLTLTFTKAHFDPDWLYDYLRLLASAPKSVMSGSTCHEHHLTY